MRRIRTKILTALIAMATMSVLLAGLVAFELSSSAISELREANLRLGARHIMEMIHSVLDEKERIFSGIGTEEILEVYANKDQYPVLLKHFMDNSGEYVSATYYTPEGKPVLRIRNGALSEPAQNMSKPALAAAGNVPEIRVVKSPEGNGYLVRFMAARTNFFDERLGVIVVDFSMDDVKNALAKGVAGKSVIALLLAGDGRTLAAAPLPANTPPTLRKELDGNASKTLLNLENGLGRLSLNGQEYLAVTGRGLNSPWSVAMLMSREAFTKEQGAMRNALIFTFSLLALLATFAAFWLSSRIAGPLSKVTEAVLRVADGDLDVRVPSRGNDEAANLAKAFNVMVDKQQTAMNKLTEARLQADAANKAKSEFLARMSHEIRTPLNAITGMTEISMQTDLTPEQRDYMQTVRDSADHLLGIVNDILDFAKIEVAKMTLVPCDFDLRQSLSSVVKMLSVQAAEKGLPLDLDIAAEVPRRILGDSARLRQILINLVGNAVKYTDNGAVRISVGLAPPRPETGPERNDSIRLLFAVEDTGVGIPPEETSTLFDAFTQVSRARTEAARGAGLGLAIAQQLVRMMGGEIEVRSEPGQGSVFFFTAEFEPGDPEKIRTPSPEDATPPCPVSMTAYRILVVEDNPINAEVLKMYLVQGGHETDYAANGLEAIEALAAKSFDLVLMDLEMPILGGVEAAKRIRAGKAGEEMRSVPIIAVTAHALSEYYDSCMQAEMNDFLPKPIAFNSLMEIIDKVMALASDKALSA